MSSLPSPDEQARIIEQLGVLCRQCGPERLLDARILRPRPDDFPDPWSATEQGVGILARRLLKHTHLHQLAVKVQLYDHRTIGGPHYDAPAWFAGIDRDASGQLTAVFGVHRDTMVEPNRLVATMAHETAHCFRRFHGIEVTPLDVEEQLTDLTTIYLGFGVLCTNGALLVRLHGGARSTSRSGYVAPQVLAFALAAQVVARDWGRLKQIGLTQWLEPDQRVYFKRALKALRADPKELRRLLGIDEPNDLEIPPMIEF